MGIITQLDVVNDMLGLLGESVVNSLTDGHPLVTTGLSRLRTANVREQSRGWWFNTETVTLPAQGDGSVLVPDDTLKIDPTDTTLPYTLRGKKLYNLENVSGSRSPYNIGQDVAAKLVRLVPFDDLPAAAAVVVSFAAQLDFCVHMDGDNDKIGNLRAALRDTTLELRAEHIRSLSPNMLRNPSVIATLGHISPARWLPSNPR